MLLSRLAATLFATLAFSASAAVTSYYTTLTPEGAGGRTGSGSATASFDSATNIFSFRATFTGLSGGTTQSHFHCCTALPFTGNAGVAVDSPSLPIPLGVTEGVFSADLDLDDPSNFNPAFITAQGGLTNAINAFVAGLGSGRVYLNIHSSTFPGGEIRGYMLLPEPGTAALSLAALAGALALRGRRRRA